MRNTYTKTNWVNHRTQISADKLNNIENAIEDIYESALSFSDLETTTDSAIRISNTSDGKIKFSLDTDTINKVIDKPTLTGENGIIVTEDLYNSSDDLITENGHLVGYKLSVDPEYINSIVTHDTRTCIGKDGIKVEGIENDIVFSLDLDTINGEGITVVDNTLSLDSDYINSIVTHDTKTCIGEKGVNIENIDNELKFSVDPEYINSIVYHETKNCIGKNGIKVVGDDEKKTITFSLEDNIPTKNSVLEMIANSFSKVDELGNPIIDTTYLAKSDDLSNLRDEIDQHLSEKSELGHSHAISDIDDFPEIPSIEGLASIEYVNESLENKANLEHIHSILDIKDFPEIPSIEGLASENYVANILKEFVLKSDAEEFVTSDYLTGALDCFKGDVRTILEGYQPAGDYLTEHQDLSDYAKKSEIEDLATKTWVEEKEYLTKHQDLSDYAKKSEIPSLEGLASESWVNSKNFIDESYLHGSQDHLKNDILREISATSENDFLKKSDAASLYQPVGNYLIEHQDLSEYAKKSELPSLSNYITKEEISKFITKDYLQGQLDHLKADIISEIWDTIKNKIEETYNIEKK